MDGGLADRPVPGLGPASPLLPPLPAADLTHILQHGQDLWSPLRGARVFLTGGTGFFGKWLVEALLFANQRLDLNLHLEVLSRDPDAFLRSMPHLAGNPALLLTRGDVCQLQPPGNRYTHFIHAATEASAALNASAPLRMFDTCVQGTRGALEFAALAGVQRFLLVSSGAVYGPQPADLPAVSEEHRGGPDPLDVSNAYAEGKRAAEWLGAAWNARGEMEVVTARAFAFLGPHLPLDAHFAAGNFLRDALRGKPIIIQGDGTAERSYLYAADLVLWLLALLLKGQAGRAYNVGSDHLVTIEELAKAVAEVQGETEVRVLGQKKPGSLPHRYVPDISRARSELGLEVRIPLKDALKRTLTWHESFHK